MAKKVLKDIAITVGVFILSYGLGFVMQDVFNIKEHITTVFVFSVFLVSLLTEGYVYGIITTFVSVLFINYTFTYPYFDFDFSVPANILSAVVMLIISLLTSAFTTKLKKWQALKAEGEKEKMRANLLRAVSHDLRTPLTTIYGASSSIIDNYDRLTDSQKTRMINGIKEDSEWLIRMVENLLSITRIDSGNVKLIKTPTVLEELIDSVIVKFKKRYPNQKVELDIPEDLVVIPMDAILIDQVIINILENAVQHAGSLTKLDLKVFVIDNKAIFEISDNGERLRKNEEIIDFTNSALTKFLIKLTSSVDQSDERVIGSYFHVINDIERIGDHAENFHEIGIEMRNKKIDFSDKACEEIAAMREKILKMFAISKDAFENLNKDRLSTLTDIEESVDDMKKALVASHFARLAEGKCNVAGSPYYSSVVLGLERVADHLVNVGYSIVNPVGSQKDNN